MVNTIETQPVLISNDSGAIDAIRFDYNWPDGYKASMVMSVKLHDQVDNYMRLGADRYYTPAGLYVPITFVHYPDYCPKQYSSTDAWLGRAPIDFSILDKIGTFVSAVPEIGPTLGFACALASAVAQGTQPDDQPTSIQRRAWTYRPGDPDTDWGRFPINPLAASEQFAWKSQYKPTQIISYYSADKWNAAGFEGQIVTNRKQQLFWSQILTLVPDAIKWVYRYDGP